MNISNFFFHESSSNWKRTRLKISWRMINSYDYNFLNVQFINISSFTNPIPRSQGLRCLILTLFLNFWNLSIYNLLWIFRISSLQIQFQELKDRRSRGRLILLLYFFKCTIYKYFEFLPPQIQFQLKENSIEDFMEDD